MTAEHKHPNYMAIFYTLFALTVVEVGIAYLPKLEMFKGIQNIRAITIILLIAFALVKALLVALYFMHLRFERRTFVVIVSAPVVLAVVLILSLLPDVGQWALTSVAGSGTQPGANSGPEGSPQGTPNDMAAPITVLLVVFGSFVLGLLLLGLSLALG